MKNGVLHICNYFAPYRGNFIYSLESLANELKKRDTDQIYLFPSCAETSESHKWIDELIKEGRQVYFQEKDFFKNIFLVKSIIKKHNVKTIYKHFSDNRIDIILSLFCRKQKVIRFFHCMYNPNISKFKNKVLGILYKNSLLVGVSQAVSENLKTAFPKCKIKTIKNAICFNRLDKTDSFPKTDKISCLCMGYNPKVKGVDLALKAVNKVREKYDIILYIALASHEDEVKNEIINTFSSFPDWVKLLPPTENIGTYYKNADIFLSPSRCEGFSYALSEAAYCNMAIVSSNIPALTDRGMDCVYWFESENIPDFVSKLELAISEYQLPEKVADRQQLKSKVENDSSISEWVENVINL